VALCLARLHQGVEVELVGVTLAVNLGHYVLVVVVPVVNKFALSSFGI